LDVQHPAHVLICLSINRTITDQQAQNSTFAVKEIRIYEGGGVRQCITPREGIKRFARAVVETEGIQVGINP
jgi:hypothetical protein